jgi:beta-glucosidase
MEKTRRRAMKKAQILCVVVATAFVLFAMTGTAPAAVAGDKPPYLDVTLPVETRVADLLSRMTMEEKVSLMNNISYAVPRLNIKAYQYWNETLHGIMGPGKFTVFPQAIAMASTWDPDLIHQVSTSISDEAWAAINRDAPAAGYPGDRFLTFWSPTINMGRDPRWGRTAETYGEDPFLTGRLALSFVRGLQGDDARYIKTVSTPKHFAVNNEEHNRLHGNAWVSETTLREYYFPAFRTAVVDGGAMSVMGAYNAVNFVPCNANRWLLTDVLRNEWGFKGFIVTDCGALSHLIHEHKYAKTPEESATLAIKAGVDVECGSEIIRSAALNAVKEGMLTEDEINVNVARLLKVRFMLGMFDPPEMNPYSKIPPSEIGSPAHVELTRQVSRESIILLKNAGAAPLLPLDAAKIGSVAIAGPNATSLEFGDYSGKPANPPVNPTEGIVAKVGGKARISTFGWTPLPLSSAYVPVPDRVLKTNSSGAPGLTAEYFNAAGFDGQPAASRIEKTLSLKQSDLPPAVKPDGPVSVRWKGRLVPEISGIYYIYVMSKSGASELIIDGKPVMEFARAEKKKADLISGQAADLDRMAEKPDRKPAAVVILEAEKSYDFEVRNISPKGTPGARLEWVAPAKEDSAAAQRDIDALRGSGAVIAFMGNTKEEEREGHDREDLDLPFGQTEYVAQLARINPKVIVVLLNGSPLSINWINDNIPSIVEAWYPGEQGGNAIADVLFGDYNPSGRMPMTCHKSVKDLPAFNDYEISHGRTYMYFTGTTLYPFGYGLSYTAFRYGDIVLDKTAAGAADTINVTFSITNTGGADGDEVAQLYVRDVAPAVKRPLKRLRGFRRVRVKKGETAKITLPLAIKDIAYWNDSVKKFNVVPGRYEILVGASSADIRLKAQFTVAR